ncbi:MAG: hypothetical protein ACSHX6_08740 [Akkermansiaceae bacterium]
MAADQPFMSKWLTRLRKDLLRSGSLTELSLHLAKNSSPKFSPEEWQLSIRFILNEEQKPHSDFVLAVDQWISQRSKTNQKTNSNDDQLDLL